MFCPKCGSHNAEDARFCSNCGIVLGDLTGPPQGAPSPGPAAPPPGFTPAATTPVQAPPSQAFVEDYMVWAILVSVMSFCCCSCLSLPLGIVAIVYATQVKGCLQRGDYAGAMAASKNARMWVIITAVAFAVLMVLNVIFYSLGMFGHNMPWMQPFMRQPWMRQPWVPHRTI